MHGVKRRGYKITTMRIQKPVHRYQAQKTYTQRYLSACVIQSGLHAMAARVLVNLAAHGDNNGNNVVVG